ncbi:MAG: DegV family protein [Candidatus Eremiobacteraeota bacterium]|nr:DegV family protein [Candidatus Eremiobacteraeota bacterium]
MAVVVITDSASDISVARAQEYGVEIVPSWIVFGDERLRDGVDITREAFSQRITTSWNVTHTEPVDIGDIEPVLRKHVEAGNECVVPVVSAKLSKTCENARMAASRFGNAVRVVDTQTLSGGQMLQTLLAAEWARSGATADEIVELLEFVKSTQRGYQIVPDLAQLRRSGRLKPSIVVLCSVLKISPVLQVKQGEIEVAEQTRSFERAQEVIIETAAQNAGDVNRTSFAVGHVGAPELADNIAAALRTRLMYPPRGFIIYEGGPTIAVNAGPGAIAVFSMTEA